MLVIDGAGFQTASCVAGVSPDDEQVTFASVSYDAVNYVTTLTFNPALTDGNYQLIICGTTSIVSAINSAVHLNNGVDVRVAFTIDTPITATSTPIVPTAPPVSPTSIPPIVPTAIFVVPTVTPAPTVVPPSSAPLQQPEELDVVELPATGERPIWAEVLAQLFGW